MDVQDRLLTAYTLLLRMLHSTLNYHDELDKTLETAHHRRHLFQDTYRIPFVFGVWTPGTFSHLHPFHSCSRCHLTISRHCHLCCLRCAADRLDSQVLATHRSSQATFRSRNVAQVGSKLVGYPTSLSPFLSRYPIRLSPRHS